MAEAMGSAGARGLGPLAAPSWEGSAGARGLGPLAAPSWEGSAGARGLGPLAAPSWEGSFARVLRASPRGGRPREGIRALVARWASIGGLVSKWDGLWS